MNYRVKFIVLLFTLFMLKSKAYSQNADPGIGILMSPPSVVQGSTGTLSVTVGNYGNGAIVANSLRVTISVGLNAEIIGIAPGSDSRWTQLSLSSGSGNTIQLTNTAGGFTSLDVGDILLIVRGNTVSGPDLIQSNIVYITATNSLLCGVPNCNPIPLNISQGNVSNSNDNSQTSLAVTAVTTPNNINAVDDIGVAVNGSAGGTAFTNVLGNDRLNSVAIVASQVNVTFVSSTNSGVTLLGTNVMVAAGTPAGTYSLIYRICEVANPTNCSTATVTVTVVANDFTPTLDINSVVFLTAGSTQDFVLNVSEILASSSVSQIIVKIPKQSAFTISYSASTTTSNVLGGVPVNNNDWLITENALFITMTLKPGVVIGASTFLKIGFTITLKSNIPSQTWQPITATIVNGSAGDSVIGNNAFNVVLKAQ